MSASFRFELHCTCDFPPLHGCHETGRITEHQFDNIDCQGKPTKAKLLTVAKQVGWVFTPDGKARCPACAKRLKSS